MAIYHYCAQIIQRSKGRSAIAAAAYRAAEKIEDERLGLVYDYTRKCGVIFSDIMAPDNAPAWVYNRAELWNQVEVAEKRQDSQLAREINIALPQELTIEQNIELIKGYIKENFVDRGMIADYAVHVDKEYINPHAHIMLTTRSISKEGFGKKVREWNPDFAYGKVQNSECYVDWRESWQNHANKALERHGYDERIDHRNYKDQGIEKIPTIHEGPHVRAMEKQGIETDRGNINREIRERNKELEEIKRQEIVSLAEYRQAKKEYENEIEGWKYYNSRERGAIYKVQEILGDNPVTYDNLESKLKELKMNKYRAGNPDDKFSIIEQEKDIRRALAALRTVELKEFAAVNNLWSGAAFLEYSEMKSIKAATGEVLFDNDNLFTEYSVIIEQIDETRQALNIYREGLTSLEKGQQAFSDYNNATSKIKELENPVNRFRGIISKADRNNRQRELEQLKNNLSYYQDVMKNAGVYDQDTCDQASGRIEILKDNINRLQERLSTDMERQTILNRGVQAVNSGNERAAIVSDISRNMDGIINISEAERLNIGNLISDISNKLTIEDRYTNIRYLSEELQNDLRDLADSVLYLPEYRASVNNYLDAQRGLIEKQYRNKPRSNDVEKALNKAYDNLRDRVAQELKNQANSLLKTDSLSRDPGDLDTGYSDKNVGRNWTPAPTKEAQEWFRRSFRNIERQSHNVSLMAVPSADTESLSNVLKDLANKLPDDMKGKAVIAYLPDDIKPFVWEAADHILKQPGLTVSLNDANYSTLRKYAAEIALYHALRLKPREYVPIKMMVNQDRAKVALEKFIKSNGELLKGLKDEALWTIEKMAESLRGLGCNDDEAVSIISRFGAEANLSDRSINDIINHYDNSPSDVIVWRGQWHRLIDNLGYEEKELLYPWFGVQTAQEHNTEDKTMEANKQPIKPPHIIPENIPAVINAFKTAMGKPEDIEEIKWTLWTSSWVLKELGVSAEESFVLLNGWAKRADIEISEARIRDIVDRAALNDSGCWLGRDNWERLFVNLETNLPPIPWAYDRGCNISIGNIVLKSVYSTVEREKVRSEIQGRKFAKWVRLMDKEQQKGHSLDR